MSAVAESSVDHSAFDRPARLAALLGEIVADQRPAAALRRRLEALDAAGDAASAAVGTALFESVFYRLPPLADDDVPAVASRLYGRSGRADPAFLLAGLVSQALPPHARPAGPLPDAVAAKAAAIIAAPLPGAPLLLALEALEPDGDWAQAALLFESVWPCVPPLLEYWVYYRMSGVYEALGRTDASVLTATLALQIEPQNTISDQPHRRLLRYFRGAGRLQDAAELCLRRRALCPEPELLSEHELSTLLASAGTLLLSPPPAGRRDQPVFGREVRAPRPWPAYGSALPRSLRDLLGDMVRPEITVSRLTDAEVLVDGGAVAVFGPDGVPHVDLSVGIVPALVRRRHAAAPPGRPVEQIALDEAVVIGDEFPGPNLCHFLLDHATRLEIYRRAGVDLGAVTVIGPELRLEYQRVVAERLGVRSYLPMTRRARLTVNRLWVSSTCHDMRHPGHWAADWAVGSVRALFDLVPRRPSRRLLVSRADSTGRRIANEAEVTAVLAPLGFEVIVPGWLSFAEQIAAFRDATHVVAPHGAGLANILFCAPGTHVLEVFHPHYGTWAYAMLNAQLDIAYASMVARDAESDAPAFNDPTLPREQTVAHSGRDMRVDIDELRRWLRDSFAC